MMRFQQKQRGFTLVELLVVIAIIGILATIIWLPLNDGRKAARDAVRVSDMDKLEKALLLYEAEHDFTYPPSASCTGGVCRSDSGLIPWIPGLDERYVREKTKDPGGHKDHDLDHYEYVSPWGSQRYVLLYYTESVTTNDRCGYGTPDVSSTCEAK